jgi:hypothetical protein
MVRACPTHPLTVDAEEVLMRCAASLGAVLGLGGVAMGGVAAASTQQPTAYVATSGDNVTMLQFTVVGGRLLGTYDSVQLASTDLTITSKACTLSGQQSDSALTVAVQCGASDSHYSGERKGGDVYLDVVSSVGTVRQLKFIRGSIAAYDMGVARLQAIRARAVALAAYASQHNVEPPQINDPGKAGPIFTVGDATEAIVTYGTSAGPNGPDPAVAIVRWAGRAWRPVASFTPFPGMYPGGFVRLHLGAGITAFGYAATQGAGDNDAGVVVANQGGTWHLVRFLVPKGPLNYSGKGRAQTTVLSPGFGSGPKVTISDIWDAGNCRQSQLYTFSNREGVFVPSGPVVNHYGSSVCSGP